MSTDKPIWVATTGTAWGLGFTENQAITRCASSDHTRADADTELSTWRVRGFEAVSPNTVEADEILESHVYECTGADLDEIDDASTDLDLEIERLLA